MRGETRNRTEEPLSIPEDGSSPIDASLPALASPPRLRDRLPEGPTRDPDAILDRFLAWVNDAGLTPYPAQEEALLELMAGRHVVLSTPTGSGKSLVALALHFKGLCEGRRSFYTAPIKALVNEKFFALCDELGPDSVGMLTGDASINWSAPVICCTAEVLSNMALRRGEATDAPYVVMDEFHYFGDRARGVAWQIPLLELRDTTFLLMSATLGNTAAIEERIHAFTGRSVAHVHSDERPVPLDFEYRETPLHETVEALLEQGRAPVYVVFFTQREAAEQAQALTSARVCSREQRQAIAEALVEARFDTPYGKDVQRFIRHGIGLHHAGLLPKYRLLVEQLAQRGLLRVVCGTDTLGVGVNIPIRSVLFSGLSKFDGEKVATLSVRDFQQIAGRAGRKGFDEHGSVVCQAPPHVVENKRLDARSPVSSRRKRTPRKKPPPGFVAWNEATFQRLITSPPETLVSRFRIGHGMVVSLLQRGEEERTPGTGYRLLIDLVNRCYESPAARRLLRRDAARVFRSLRSAGLVRRIRDAESGCAWLRVGSDLQRDFSLHHSLSLYLVDAVSLLDPDQPDYALDVLSLVEAVLENPRPILQQQTNRAKQELVAALKAQGVPYEERIEKLEEVTHPKPNAEFTYRTFNLFAQQHPWLAEENIRPKSVAREMWEGYEDFPDYVRRYGIQRSEGLLLRYLSQVHNTLVQSVPEYAHDDQLADIIGFFRAMLGRVDSSLVEEWESRSRSGEPAAAARPRAPELFDLARHPKLLHARIRAELYQLVRALAMRHYADAADCVRQDPEAVWDAARFEAELEPFYAEYDRIVFEPRARQAHQTLVKAVAPRRWDVHHVLVDERDENLWNVEGEVDLSVDRSPKGPLLRLRRIGT